MKTKTKRGGRELNPTDAYRKQARKREIKRNRAERTYIRDAFGKAQNTSKLAELKAELEELIKIEQTGELNKLQKLRKRVVLEAYEVAVRKKKEEEIREKEAAEEGKQPQHGGLSSVPLPKPPPLPAGPKPGLPPPPMPPPLPTGPGPAAAAAGSSGAAGLPILPPPPGPPPAAAAAGSSNLPVLPPPPGPPPPARGVLPPPPGPPPGYGLPGMLPPPAGPPPMGMLPPPAMPPPAGASILPPPAMPPPGSSSILPPPLAPPPAAGLKAAATAAAASKPAGGTATTITGASTVTKRPLAHKDKTLTAMVPASVLVRREAAAKAAKVGMEEEELSIGPGFGLAPVQKAGGPGGRGQKQLLPPQMGRWGNAVTVTTVAAGSKPAGAKPAAAAAGGGGGRADDQMADFMSSLKDLGAFD